MSRIRRTASPPLPTSSTFVPLADTLERLLNEKGETEYLWEPTLPRIRFVSLQSISASVRELEGASAVLCERHRIEYGLFRDERGGLWLVKGSPNGVTAPLAAIAPDHSYDLVSHTHPVTEATPSEGDLDILERDRDRRGAVVSIIGQRRDYTRPGNGTEKISDARPIFDARLAGRTHTEQLQVHMFAAVQEDFRAARDYLALPGKAEEPGLKERTLVYYEQLLASIEGKTQPKHTSLEPKLARAIRAAIEALRSTL